jgi:hypothetical protein
VLPAPKNPDGLTIAPIRRSAESQSTTAFMQYNGQVERFNSRIASEMLAINVAGHAGLEILLACFNRAYNRRRQRVLQGNSPRKKMEERITLAPVLVNPLYKPSASDNLMTKVDDIIKYAIHVSQSDK